MKPLKSNMIQRILVHEECNYKEYKKEFYKLPDDRAEMVKDFSALANSTTIGKEAWLVVGYKNEQYYDVWDTIPDEASIIQQSINELV